MTTSGNAEGHVQLQLGLYVLGALSHDEQLVVEEHLARCADCAADCAELGEVPPFLDLLTPADFEALASARSGPAHASPGVSAQSTPAVSAQSTPAVSAQSTPAVSAQSTPTQATPGPAGQSPPAAALDGSAQDARPVTRSGRPATSSSARPAGRAESVRPASKARQTSRRSGPARRFKFTIYAVALALVVGVGIGLWLRSTTPVTVRLAGTETNTVTGVRMSVTVVGQDGRSDVNADVTGLRPGVEYELYAVNVRGETRVVARWVADDRPYGFDGDLDAETDDLAFFTVATADGSVVVTVRVARPTGR